MEEEQEQKQELEQEQKQELEQEQQEPEEKEEDRRRGSIKGEEVKGDNDVEIDRCSWEWREGKWEGVRRGKNLREN